MWNNCAQRHKLVRKRTVTAKLLRHLLKHNGNKDNNVYAKGVYYEA